MKQTEQDAKSSYPKYGFLSLLLTLVFTLAFVPFFYNFDFIRTLLEIFVTLILISALYTFSQQRRFLIIGLTLASIAFVTSWIVIFSPQDNPVIILISDASSFLFLIFLMISILNIVLMAKRIDSDIIYGAICVYLLFGIAWALLYQVISTIIPNSFDYPITDFNALNFFYFSFTTLTTLGYGDITPISPPAQAMTNVEAIFGQLYLTILIARLINIHVSQKQSRN